MFKTAATKIAHNSTLPALAGNKDLRPLQDLITAEKAVLVSLQKLSVDFNKASEALRTWGAGEGEDLGDTLSASTTILGQFSSALSQYASREHAVRDEMKNVRSREEALDELKRRRKSLVTKADSAEKKLNKMNPENKNLQSQTDILNRLKDEIRVMDTEIMAEEASLGDFKRLTTRTFMSIKFGGLLECCEKGLIAGEYGKLVISEIPVDTTQPGLPRSMYGGHAKTEGLIDDAVRRINEVTFSSLSDPPEGSRQFQSQALAPYGSSTEPLSADVSPRVGMWDSGGHSPIYLGTPQGLGRDNFLDAPPSPAYTPGETHEYLHQPHPQQPPAKISRRSVDDFGVHNPSPSAGARDPGGRFSTFPAKGNRGFTLHDNPVPRAENDESFSASVADALPEPNFSEPQTMGPNDYNTPYEIAHPSTIAPSPRLPPGAGAGLGNPWSDSGTVTSIGSHDKRLSSISDAEPQLAYMTDVPEPVEENTSNRDGSDDGVVHGEDMHVHFGRVSGAGEAMRGRDHSSENRDPPSMSNPPHRVPPPSFDPDDEQALNAAAAREVSRELDALNFSPPSPSTARAPGSSFAFGHPPSPSDRVPSPLAPPAPPFAQRAVSPMPVSTESSPYQQSRSQISSSTQLYSSSSPKVDSFAPPNLQDSPASNNSPYRTPPENPRGPASSISAPPMNLSSSSLGGQVTPGTRTISAAAFKRPQPRLASLDVIGGGGLADTSPLAFKKRLPSSPYPQRSSGFSSPITPAESPSLSRPQQREHVVEPAPRNSHLEDDDQFDYISAYVNSIGTADDDANDYRRPEHGVNGARAGA